MSYKQDNALSYLLDSYTVEEADKALLDQMVELALRHAQSPRPTGLSCLDILRLDKLRLNKPKVFPKAFRANQTASAAVLFAAALFGFWLGNISTATTGIPPFAAVTALQSPSTETASSATSPVTQAKMDVVILGAQAWKEIIL